MESRADFGLLIRLTTILIILVVWLSIRVLQVVDKVGW